MRIITRLIPAFGHSVRGLKLAVKEPAFLLEAIVFLVALALVALIPLPLFYAAAVIAAHLLLLIVELLNTAIERTVDRISHEKHALSGMAKDIASAAVFITILLVLFVWAVCALSLINH